MFTLIDKEGNKFLEVRREPVSGELAERVKGIFSPTSSHVKLCNRYCYYHNAIEILSNFLNEYKYSVNRIYRFDLCLDFERFDSGDDPQRFVQRYMSNRYSKVNQSYLTAHGEDRWEGRSWGSLSWGNAKSMVSTKLYCKSKELKEVGDKPYIRWAWFQAGLVSDFHSMTKVKSDGSVYAPAIWRLEFSIKSSAQGWFYVDTVKTKSGKPLVFEHTLDTYATKEAQLTAFENLALHYFKFKHYEAGKRKYDCEDKILFKWREPAALIKLDKLPRQAESTLTFGMLIRQLERWKISHFGEEEATAAADEIIAICKKEQQLASLKGIYEDTELERMRLMFIAQYGKVVPPKLFMSIWEEP